MSGFSLNGFRYPTTRYSGSKRRLLDWIWENLRDIEFSNVLDVFGGTASVSLLFKKNGKMVYYNDLLKFNQIIGKAIVENNSTKVSEEDIKSILQVNGNLKKAFIQEHFSGIYFLDYENIWIDKIAQNISRVSDEYKRSILMASLFQACLAKRPFNLFHRANLNIRIASVKRTFGNKKTWETPFPDLFIRYVREYNNAVFSNKKRNKVIGGFNALNLAQKSDLVYLDPPYFSEESKYGTNYLTFYHFLEGLADYPNWKKRIDLSTKTRRINDSEEIRSFVRKSMVLPSFEKLIQKFSDRIIVLSYQSGGLPAKGQIIEIFKKNGKKVRVFEKDHRYVLSAKSSKELLFVTTN